MHISNLMNLATPSFVFQPGPDSIGAFALRRLTGVVAAQACALIDLEAFKVIISLGDFIVCKAQFTDYLMILNVIVSHFISRLLR